MENKSKLPKPAGLRPPQVTRPVFDRVPTASTVSKLPPISRAPAAFRLRRRSKSVSDLRKLPDAFVPKITELKKISENVVPKVVN